MKTDPLKAALEEMEKLKEIYCLNYSQQIIDECISILRKHMTKSKSRVLSKDKISAKNKNG